MINRNVLSRGALHHPAGLLRPIPANSTACGRNSSGRVLPELEKHAAQEYLDGFQIIGLQADRLPNLTSISARLAPRTGWSSTPVSGFLPAPAFFEMLPRAAFRPPPGCAAANRSNTRPSRTSSTTSSATCPMHAHQSLRRFSRALRARLRRHRGPRSAGKAGPPLLVHRRVRRHPPAGQRIKVYGSGLISSHGECRNVIEGHCAIHDFSLDEVLKTPVKVDELHKLLFAVNSFDQIYEAMHEAERRAISG